MGVVSTHLKASTNVQDGMILFFFIKESEVAIVLLRQMAVLETLLFCMKPQR